MRAYGPTLAAALLCVASAGVAQRTPGGPAAPSAGADAGGPIEPADIMRLHDMRDTQASPDGRTVLFTVTAQVATFDSPESTIWRVAADGRSPARRFVSVGIDDHPRWSPDGTRVAFLSHPATPAVAAPLPSDEKAPPPATAFAPPATPPDVAPSPAADADVSPRQLWLAAAVGGAPVRLTRSAGDVTDFAWSPDGRRLAFLASDPETPAERADRLAKREPGVVVDAGTRFTRLWVMDVAGRTARLVSPAGVNVSALAWSPDGGRIAVKVADTPSINDLFYHSRVALLDPVTGALGPALIEHAAEEPRWSPDGRSLLAEVIRTPGFIGLGLRVVDVATGATRALADDHPGLLTEARWSADGRAIVALSFEKTRSRLVRIAAHDGAVTPLADFDGEASGLSLSRDDARVAVALSSPDRPADVWTLAGRTPRALTRIDPRVAGWRLGRVREESWRSSVDGRPIYGVLVTPPGWREGTPLPTVVQGHGGPEWAWWSGWLGSWHEWAQMLSTHGYAVLLPNPRGSDGQGTDFARAVGRDWGGADYQDVMDGVDMLVARRVADPARLGIGGWSYGGFLSAWAVTHGSRFKAAVVGAGPVDMAAMARITDTPDFPLGYFGEPQAHLADLDRVSPARLLDRVTTPVLVLHGAADTRVPPTLGLEFYRGLRLLGRETRMVRYPGEPHWFHDPGHQRDVQERVLAWFDHYLKRAGSTSTDRPRSPRP